MPVAFQNTAFGGAHMFADQDQRQLIGQQFVIGQAHALRRGGREIVIVRRNMRLAQRFGERRPGAHLEIRLVEPFGHHRHAVKRTADRFGQRFGGKAFGQRIDRLVQRHVGIVFHHIIGMRHLQAIVEAFYPPADDASRSDRQGFVQIVFMGVEEDEFDGPGVVATTHAIRLALVARRQMVEHVDGRWWRCGRLRRRSAWGDRSDRPRRQADRKLGPPSGGPQLARSVFPAAGRCPAGCAFRRKGETESLAAWCAKIIMPRPFVMPGLE